MNENESIQETKVCDNLKGDGSVHVENITVSLRY